MALMSDDDFEFMMAPRDEDEGLFSRDVDGQLVRLDAPTVADYTRNVIVQIDGKPVTVPLAEPLKDAQGNVVLDIDGRTTPRYTTIYDAAAKLSAQEGGAEVPIPILCHQPHMTPVAVCRMCVVQVYGQKRGKRAPERKLLPACQHQVKDKMEVFTWKDPGPDGDRVRRAVNVVTELLTADHLKPAPAPAPAAELAPFNELQRMNDLCGLTGSRFKLDVLSTPARPAPPVVPPAGSRGLDASSPVFLVDHSACILCDRCSRACDEVKRNNIIGRTGKGPTAGIGFDLNEPMGESNCVQCGECMVSCPTSAITFKPVARVKVPGGSRGVEILAAAELKKEPLFAAVPPKFLLWQEGLVVRRKVSKDEVLCRQGDPGNTAFLMKQGRLKVTAWDGPRRKEGGGLLGLFKSKGKPPEVMATFERGPADIVLGEMACLSGTPRTADVTAMEDGEVWEIRRNVLDRIMRSPAQRDRFEGIYRKHALDFVLRNSELFHGLPEDEYRKCVDFLRPKLTFVRVNPGQSIFRQGDWADSMYLVRLGHVRVGIRKYDEEATVLWRGPGTVIGEIGLLAIAREDVGKESDAIDKSIGAALAEAGGQGLGAALPAGQRTATCTALDHLELARLGRRDFLEMVRTFPALRRRLIDVALGRLRGDDDERPAVREYVELGLYQGQSLLVLDLDKCTRCDECTKACVQQHGTESHGAPVTRLLREGRRFDHFLVATSCRSCKDAYCMIGCPVDSIHRGKHQQIVIEDHCIGCGLCASNCPYGNISMLPNERRRVETPDPDRPGATRLIAQRKASTCDLCDAEGNLDAPEPRCVYACPHDAAHRMTGAELLREIAGTEPIAG